MKVLIVGAAAVSGRAAMKAARSLGATIVATTSRESNVDGADETIYGVDLEKENAVEKILSDTRVKNIDYIVYIPARGAVGMDITESTAEMIPPSLAYSVEPYLKLSKALNPKRTIALSGFMGLPAMASIYGTMTFTKVVMEELAIRHPERLQILRIGMFYSNSVRGIALLAQRRFMREKNFHSEWHDEWKASGKKFSDFFYDKNYRSEEETYREHANGVPFRPTEPGDIADAFCIVFQGEKSPIINVLGAWRWFESTMPHLPEAITSRMHLIDPYIYELV